MACGRRSVRPGSFTRALAGASRRWAGRRPRWPRYLIDAKAAAAADARTRRRAPAGTERGGVASWGPRRPSWSWRGRGERSRRDSRWRDLVARACRRRAVGCCCSRGGVAPARVAPRAVLEFSDSSPRLVCRKRLARAREAGRHPDSRRHGDHALTATRIAPIGRPAAARVVTGAELGVLVGRRLRSELQPAPDVVARAVPASEAAPGRCGPRSRSDRGGDRRRRQ